MDETLFDGQKPDSPSLYRLATINAVTELGASVVFEGENTSSGKIYKIVQSYHPAENDRVVLLATSGTYIILGSVGAPVPAGDYIPASEKGIANGVATLNEAGKLTQIAVQADNASVAGSIKSFGGITNLPADAALTTVVSKVNSMLGIMRESGMLN